MGECATMRASVKMVPGATENGEGKGWRWQIMVLPFLMPPFVMQVAFSASRLSRHRSFCRKNAQPFPQTARRVFMALRQATRRPADQSPLSMREGWHGCRNGWELGREGETRYSRHQNDGWREHIGRVQHSAPTTLPSREEANRLRGTRL